MNCQIVLCPGINDGAELDRTINDLASLLPYTLSLSVVPVGLTRYREGLCKLKAFDADGSRAVIEQVHAHQERIFKEHGTRFVYLSDEFYLNAGVSLPSADEYEGFPQIENGVGLAASLLEEFEDAVGRIPKRSYNRNIAIATGELAAPIIRSLAARVEAAAPGVKVTVYAVKNEFFGGGVNVAGLVCGGDIIKTMGDARAYDEVLIPDSMLRDGEDIFLDDVTLDGLCKALGRNVVPTPNDGYIFIENIIGTELDF